MISAFGVDHGEISKGLGSALKFHAGNVKMQVGVLRQARAVERAGMLKAKKAANPLNLMSARPDYLRRMAVRDKKRVIRQGRRALQQRHQDYINANPPKWMNP